VTLVYDLYCGHGGVGLALDELGVEFVGVVDYSPIAGTTGTVCPHCDTAQRPKHV